MLSSLFFFSLVPWTFATGQVPAPQWDLMNTYEVEESASLQLTNPSSTDLTFTANGTYTLSQTFLQQTLGSYSGTCYLWQMNADTATVGGHIDQADPLPLNGDLRILDPDLQATLWYDETSLALARRSWKISGDMEVEMGPTWFPVGTLEFNIFEEYDPPLQVFQFPLSTGTQWSQGPVRMYASGGVWDFNAAWSAGNTGNAPISEPCDSYEISFVSDSGSSGTGWYCQEAEWFALQEERNRPLGATGVWNEHRVELQHWRVEPPGCIEQLHSIDIAAAPNPFSERVTFDGSAHATICDYGGQCRGSLTLDIYSLPGGVPVYSQGYPSRSSTRSPRSPQPVNCSFGERFTWIPDGNIAAGRYRAETTFYSSQTRGWDSIEVEYLPVPTPTPTETPLPSPHVQVAGYLDTVLSGSGGNLILWALTAEVPAGEDLYLGYQGIVSPLTFQRSGEVFVLEVPFPPGVTSGQYPLEVWSGGRVMWPYLRVE